MQSNLSLTKDSLEGLKDFLQNLGLFRSIGSTINSRTLAQNMSIPEMEAYANDEMNEGRGIRRYDGSWSRPEDVLDSSIFQTEDLLKISYGEDGKAKLNDLSLTKDLGWLGTNVSLKDYINNTKNTRAKSQYEKLIEGKSLEVLNSIRQNKENEQKGIFNASDKGKDVKGRFTLMTDENGKPYWLEVLTDANTRKTMEAAGISLVNAYGPNKYSDGVLKSGVRSFIKGLADVVPNIAGVIAGARDIREASLNGITGKGFIAEKDATNEFYEAANKYLNESLIGKTSYVSQQGLFDNWESFSSQLGQGASSLIQYGAVGRGIGLAQKGLTKATAYALPKVLRSANFMKSAEKVATVLSEKGITDTSLGTVGKFINKSLIENPYLIPMYGSGIVLNYGEAYQAAIDAGLPLQDAALIGTTTGILNTLVETKYGPNTMAKYLLGRKGASETAKAIIKEVGGDVSKLENKAISDNVVKKIFNKVEKIMEAPIIGTMAEEGSEEGIQGFVKNSVESFYDSFLAPNSAEEKNGRFGTEIFSGESLLGMLEDSTVGALLGALGGFANSRQKEKDNIIPYIVNNNFSEFEAGAALALQKQAITKEQYDGIMDRANTLLNLYDKNRNLFYRAASVVDKGLQLNIMTDLLSKISDLEAFANLNPSENGMDNLDKLSKIVNELSDSVGAIDLLLNFASLLKEKGKKVEADLIEDSLKDTTTASKSLFKDLKQSKNNDLQFVAIKAILAQIFNNIFNNKIINEQNNKLRANQLSLQAKIEANNTTKDSIRRINNILSGDKRIAKSTENLQKLIEEYTNDNTKDDKKESIRLEIKKQLEYLNYVLTKEFGKTNNSDILTYMNNISILAINNVSSKLMEKDLSDLIKSAPEIIKDTEALYNEINEKKKLDLNNQSEKQEQDKQKEEAEFTVAVNQPLEDAFTAYKESIRKTNPELASKLDSDDGMTVVNALESERKIIVDRLNSARKELKNDIAYKVLSQQVKDLNNIIPYMRTKYNIIKSEYDKNKRYNLNLKEDKSTYTDPSTNQKYKINRNKLQYSEKTGLIVPITEIKDDNEEVLDYKEYTELENSEFLNSLIDENNIPLSRKLRSDKQSFFMTQNKVGQSFAEEFEPNSEDETTIEHENKKAKQYFANMLKGIPIGETFQKILSNPKYKASEYYGSVEAYTWDKIDDDSKKAKELFDSVKGNKKYDELSKEEKDLLIDYLPLLIVLNHDALKTKEGQLYNNIVAIPSRKSKTSQKFPMNEDLVALREALIKSLIANGKYSIEKGDIEIQPGYYNQTASEKTIKDDLGITHVISSTHNKITDVKSLNIKKEGSDYYFVDPTNGDKERVVIGIADDNGIIRYTELQKDGQVFERTVDGQGSPGTPYLVLPTFVSLNKKQRYAVKLNPTKIDKEVATTIAKLMYSLAKGYKSKEVLLNTTVNSLPDVFGIKADKSTTIQDVLDELIFWGKKTIQNGENNRSYLENKQVYIDFAKGQVRYGDKQTILGDSNEELEKFINWITENKSLAINRAKINSFDKTDATFSIGNKFSVKIGEDYLSHIIELGVVTTDLNTEGPLYSKPMIRLKLIKEQKPSILPQPDTIFPNETVKSTVEEGKRKNTKKFKSVLSNSTGPVELKIKFKDGTTNVKNDLLKVVGSIDEIKFIYENGKLNGIPVPLGKENKLNEKGGLLETIANIIQEHFKKDKADVLKSDIGDIEIVSKKTEPQSDQKQEITYSSEIDKILPTVIKNLQSKFKDKTPSKADIDIWLDQITNQTNGVAKIYGFTDYKQAREALQAVGSNGLTLQLNLIDYLTSDKPQELESNDKGKDKLKDIVGSQFGFPTFGGANKIVTEQDKKRNYKRITSDEKNDLRRILGKRFRNIKWVNDFIDVLDYVGNPAKAHGIMTRTAMVLYKNAKSGTGYHESFHNVSLFLLTPKQREQMYSEARAKYNMRKASNKEIEEKLADEFMLFAEEARKNKQQKSKIGIIGFFNKIWEWAKRQFGFRPAYKDINALFEKIYKGDYAKVKTDKSSLLYFDNAYGKDAKIPLIINGHTINMNTKTLYNITNSLTAQLLFDNNITSIDSVRKGINFDTFKLKIKSILDSSNQLLSQSKDINEIEKASTLINIYSEIYNNWDTVFKPLIENKLDEYGIRRKRENTTLTINEDLSNLINDEVKASWEINAKHNAKAEIRMLFLALPESNEVDQVTMLPKYANPDLVWFKVQENLHTAKSYDEMMQRLTKLSDEIKKQGNNGVNPYSYLLLMLNSGNQTLKTQFFTTFKKHRNKFVNFSYVENGEGMDINIGDADINKRSSDINRLWSKIFALKQPLLYPDKFKEVKKKYLNLIESINDNSNIEEKVSEFVSLLTNFEVNVDNKTIFSFMNEPAYADNNDARSLKNFLNSSLVSSVFGSKKSGKSMLDKLIKKAIKEEEITNLLAKDSFFKALSKRYVKSNPISEDDSIPGPEGNLVYSYSDNNTITSMFEEWLKDEDFLKQLVEDPYASDSYWLNQLLKDSKTRNSLSVSTMLALMDKENYSESRGYLDISDKEDLIIKLKAVMEGKLPLPTLANKKSYYFINGVDKFVVKTLFEKGRGLVLNNTVIDRFVKYANTEIQTIKQSEKTINDFLNELDLTKEEFNSLSAKEQRNLLQQKSKESPKFQQYYKDLVANYHYSIQKENTKKDGIIIYDTKIKLGANGSKFRYFNELQERLNSGESIDQIEKYSNSSEFKKVIERILYKRINDTIRTFIKVGIINTSNSEISNKINEILNNDNSIAYSAISQKDYNYIPVIKNKDGVGEYQNSPTVLAQIIADYAINTAITNIEFEKVVSGDLAFYKSKNIAAALDDRVKRFSALTSTKQIMRNDVVSSSEYPVDFDTNKYRTITLGTNTTFSKIMFDLMYDKYVGTMDNPGLLFSRFIKFAEEGRQGYTGKTKLELYEMAQEDAQNRLDGYKSVDPTDALVWISPKMFRKLAIMNGEWNEKKEKAYNLLESDKVLTEEEEIEANELVMQPLKYIHYGFRFNSKGLKIPIYDKMSLATVFRRNAAGTNIMAMYKYMMLNDVDMVKMESAVKSGNSPFYTFYDENGKINDLSNSLIYEQDFKYIGKQLVTDPHNVESTTLLTLFIKIVASNVSDTDVYTMEGKKITGKELKQQYVDAIVNLSDRGARRIEEQFGFKDGEINKSEFMKLLQNILLDGSSTQNLREALKYAEQDNDYFIEPSVLPCINQIQSKLISKIKKETIDVKTPGNAFYQTTSFGYDLTGNYRKITNKNTTKKFDDKLKFLNENGRLEVKISIDLFNGMIPAKYKTFEEQRLFILNNPELFAFSYRVPTQGKNSTLAIQIVDVLPHSAGNVILLPYEVTTLTGSDFDIDKMYIASYNYYEKDGKFTKVPFIDPKDYDSQEEFLDAIYYNRYGFKKSLEFKNIIDQINIELDFIAKVSNGKALTNESIQQILDLASNNSNLISRRKIIEILSRPSDSFDIIKKLKEYVLSLNNIPDEIKFIENNRGKSMWELNTEEAVENRLLDVFAAMQVSDNSFIDSTTPLDVTTKPIKDMAEDEATIYDSMEPLFPTYQEDIKSKNTGADSGIGPMALINSFRSLLQLAKIELNEGGILKELGVKSLAEVYDKEGISILDWTSALINAHVDAAKDPYIMKLNVNKFTYSMTAFLTAIGFGKTTFSLLPQPILVDLANNYMKYHDSNIGVTEYDKYSNKYIKETEDVYLLNTNQKDIDNISREEMISNIKDSEWLEQLRKTPEDQRDSRWYANQYKLLQIYKELTPYANALSDLVAAALIDTAKFGINASELLVFRHLIEKVLSSKLISNSEDVFKNTFLGKKYDNSVKLLFDMLQTLILDFSPTFVLLIEKVQNITNTYFKKDPTIANYISNEIKSAVFTNFFKNVENGNIKELFFGDNSVVSRISRLLADIINGKYRDLKDNQLLKILLPNVYNSQDKPMMFENSIVKQRDTESKNEITFAWRDLLEHEDEQIRQLGEDLIKYAFYLGGGTSSGIYNFYDLAPYDYLANILNKDGITFQQYTKDVLKSFNEGSIGTVDANLLYNIFESMFRGSKNNDKLIPLIKFKENKTKLLKDKEGNVKYIKMLGDYNNFLTNADYSVRPFVKTKDNRGNVTLYKLVGYLTDETGEVEYIYARTYTTGYSNKGFRVKEGIADTQINDKAMDYAGQEIKLNEKMLDGKTFVRFTDSDIYNYNANENSNVEYNEDGTIVNMKNEDAPVDEALSKAVSNNPILLESTKTVNNKLEQANEKC